MSIKNYRTCDIRVIQPANLLAFRARMGNHTYADASNCGVVVEQLWVVDHIGYVHCLQREGDDVCHYRFLEESSMYFIRQLDGHSEPYNSQQMFSAGHTYHDDTTIKEVLMSEFFGY